MTCIITGIVTLDQYLEILKNDPAQLRSVRCPHCGLAGVWAHGAYSRKPDRSKPSSLNPIPILRFYCRGCHKTCSALPECIPARRWYQWPVQQMALTSSSQREAARATGAARSTVARWRDWLAERTMGFRNVLVGLHADLGRAGDAIADFWSACFVIMPMGAAMRLCHAAGVPVP